jgi:hypothetical protein
MATEVGQTIYVLKFTTGQSSVFHSVPAGTLLKFALYSAKDERAARMFLQEHFYE